MTLHPKRGSRCAFCKRWSGDAKLTFVNPSLGFRFDMNAFGTCMANNSKQHASSGTGCKHYEPSVEASRIL